jgi:hypothetical protein
MNAGIAKAGGGMFFVLVFPLLVMYFSMLRSVFQLPSQTPARETAHEDVLDNQRAVLTRATRRSTRIRHAIQVKVTAITLAHGLCTEEVAADTVSCHGFAFKWKYDVPIDSKVVLELHDKSQTGQPVFARGIVKWHQHPGKPDQNALFHTAIQLEKPENIWKVASPPADWLPFCQPKYFVPAQSREPVAASQYVS